MKVKPSSELTPQERDELAKYLPKGIDVNRMADCFYLMSQNFKKLVKGEGGAPSGDKGQDERLPFPFHPAPYPFSLLLLRSLVMFEVR